MHANGHVVSIVTPAQRWPLGALSSRHSNIRPSACYGHLIFACKLQGIRITAHTGYILCRAAVLRTLLRDLERDLEADRRAERERERERERDLQRHSAHQASMLSDQAGNLNVIQNSSSAHANILPPLPCPQAASHKSRSPTSTDTTTSRRTFRGRFRRAPCLPCPP